MTPRPTPPRPPLNPRSHVAPPRSPYFPPDGFGHLPGQGRGLLGLPGGGREQRGGSGAGSEGSRPGRRRNQGPGGDLRSFSLPRSSGGRTFPVTLRRWSPVQGPFTPPVTFPEPATRPPQGPPRPQGQSEEDRPRPTAPPDGLNQAEATRQMIIVKRDGRSPQPAPPGAARSARSSPMKSRIANPSASRSSFRSDEATRGAPYRRR